ncbi:MAG: IS66 family insertion sequence element accessory protein TnpB [Cellvibrio sp.]|nr:IS66 family insertion sequence element accessory protein TnpB [Cellvibrio sp.]
MMRWESVSVYVHRDPVDFRQSINGLSIRVSEVMALDVFSGALFVFGNRSRNKIKILYWDKTGFALWYKRLEKNKFKWPRKGDAVLSFTDEQFDWLLRGLDIEKLTPHTESVFTDSC